MIRKTKISVAAVPYFWSKTVYWNFYKRVALSSADIIYLGETVCSKRRSMTRDDWLKLAEFLTQAGKQVVLSSLTLLESESELGYLKKIASQSRYLIEANDVAGAEIAHQNNHQFVTGTAINIYNSHSLKRLFNLGMKRWVVPVELGQEDLSEMLLYAKQNKIEVEYQVFGRIPLAYSARCFTARHHQLSKDNCQLVCHQHHQGILAKTQEGDNFAQLNGIQTQSAKVVNLMNHCQSLKKSGINIMRVMPLSAKDTLVAIQQLDAILNSKRQLKFSPQPLENEYQYCNGYWFQIEGMKYIS